MSRIILISGGQRSGKSFFAETLALKLAQENCTASQKEQLGPVYVATAMIQDDEFADRVAVHQSRRGSEWVNIEEPRQLGHIQCDGRVILIDCLTLWASNFFFASDVSDAEQALIQMKQEIDMFVRRNPDSTLLFVTNEIGLGGVSGNDVQRRFADLLGLTNQYVAALAQEAYLVISGIAVRIKDGDNN